MKNQRKKANSLHIFLNDLVNKDFYLTNDYFLYIKNSSTNLPKVKLVLLFYL